ncbi:hypothetical protein [Rhodococcus sp. NPDC058514]
MNTSVTAAAPGMGVGGSISTEEIRFRIAAMFEAPFAFGLPDQLSEGAR